ncbi:MAG TPA: sulfatase [Thermogutta sp.]|nr:sulfatase [Thermogutta sp.]
MRVFMSRWSGSTALLGLVGIGLSLLHGSTGWASEVNRPNFLVIIADDMACEDCGAYGHPHIKTPNIDQLAREGMLFERAFLTCSSCSPSRTSLLTGRYPHATGAAELHQPVPPDQLLVTTPLREAGYFTAAAGKWHLGPHVKSQFDVVREGGGDGAYDYWLPVLKERPKDKPFFIWLATTDPHRPYGPNRIPEPHTPQDVIVPPYLPDVPEVREDLALYYDEIGRLDTWVGRIREELIAQGVWDQTMVVFLSDNGRPFPRCKTTVLDSGVRTPLIVRWPGRIPAGSVSSRLVSAVDLAPTILELAGITPGPSFQGRSFAKLFDDPTAKIRDYVYAEHNWHDYQAYERSIRNERFLLIKNWLPQLPRTPPADAVRSPTYDAMKRLRAQGKLTPPQMEPFVVPRPEVELYDCENDPHNLTNLADRPEYSTIKSELLRALETWREQTGDSVPEPLTPDKFDRETGKRL